MACTLVSGPEPLVWANSSSAGGRSSEMVALAGWICNHPKQPYERAEQHCFNITLQTLLVSRVPMLQTCSAGFGLYIELLTYIHV